MNWKGFERKELQPNLRNHTSIYLERMGKTLKIFSQDIWSLGQDLNPGTLEYGTGVLPI
jgi:hypothetical protein